MLGRYIHRCFALNRCWITQSLRFYSQTYYEVLGVPKNASTKQVQEAFLEKSKQLHPDKKMHDAEQHDKFVKLNEAYTCLSRPDSRQEYDAILPSANSQRVEVGGIPKAGKRGLFRVPKRQYYQMIVTSAIAGVLFGMFYLVTLDMYRGREQELFLVFKSPEAPDEGEEE